MHNPRRTGGGGILRDHHGKLVYAYAIPLVFGINNTARLRQHCRDLVGVNKMVINELL